MSALKRFFVDNISEMTELLGEEFEHAKNVLRLGVGEEVILLDNSQILSVLLGNPMRFHCIFPLIIINLSN